VSPDTAKRLISEFQMGVAFTLPDTVRDTIL
jgi:hypothetical protein